MQRQKQRNASINLLVKKGKEKHLYWCIQLTSNRGIPGPKGMSCLITHRQRSCGKVIFSRVFVCPFRYLWSHVPSGGEYCISGPCPLKGDMVSGGRISGAVFGGGIPYSPGSSTHPSRILSCFGSFSRKPLENEKNRGYA